MNLQKLLRSLSIKHKIIILIFVATGTIGSALFTALMIIRIRDYKADMLNNSLMNTQLIGENVISSIAFEDQVGAYDIISKLKTVPSFSNATLFDALGDVFSKYPDTLQNLIAPPEKLIAFQTFTGNELLVFEPIFYHDDYYGSIYVSFSTKELTRQINNYILLMLGIFIIAVITTYFLANKFQKIISGPIESLTDFTGLITKTADYSLRIQPKGDDEIGKLYTDFNEMIFQIQQREEEKEVAEKSLKESQQKYSNLVEGSTDGIIIIQKGKIVFANQRICDMLSKPVNAIVGTKYLSHLDKKYHKSIINTVKDIQQGDNYNLEAVEVEIIDSKNQPVPVEISETEIDFKNSPAQMVILRDITERKKKEEEVMKLSQAVEQSPSTVCITDVNGYIEYVNTEYIRSTGYEKDEVLGKKPNILNEKFIGKEIYNEVWKKLKNGDSWKGEIENNKRNGELFWELTSLSGLKNIEGEITNYIIVSKDITEEKHLDKIIRESNEKMSLILENSPMGIYHFDKDGTITMCNSAFAKLIGVGPQKVVGFNVIRQTKTQKIIDAINKTIHGQQAIFEGEYQHPLSDKKLYIRSIYTPLFSENKEFKGGICIYEDVSERIKSEKLSIEKEAAVETSKSKSEFLARMSHEIRTPMNAIIGLSHLCLQTDLNFKQRDYVEKTHRSAKSLLGIINDILDFSKIEAGKLSIEKVEFQLENVLDDIATLMNMKVQQKGLEFIFSISSDVPLILVGDPLRLGQILTNLINNAVKFTEKGEVALFISKIGQDEKEVNLKFIVKDSGIGMTPDQKDKLFIEFSQVDGSTTRKYGGTGLGLVIAKKIIQMMGGNIEVESETDKGSSFIFNAKFGICKQKITTTGDIPEINEMKVLVCDDNKTVRKFLKISLNSLNFRTTVAGSGEEAIEILEESPNDPFRLVIMDYMMPDQNGIETIKKIKKSSKIKVQPKVILLTAFGNDELLMKAKESGIDDYLLKPITRSSLFDAITNLFAKTAVPGVQVIKVGTLQEKMKNIAGSNILLAEDNDINQQIAIELFESVGMNVDIANNGREAVEKMNDSGRPSMYNIVLMDIQMPEMDGITATVNIRKNPEFDSVPIVAMTADAMVGVSEKCYKAGMNDFVTKPIDPDEVFTALIKWIKKKEGTEKLNIPKPARKEIVPKKTFTEYGIPDIPVVNTHKAFKKLGIGINSYINILKKFYSSNIGFIEDLKSEYNEGNIENTIRMLHTMKGVSGSIGATELQAISLKTENMIKENKNVDIEVIVNEFEEILNPVLESIFKILIEPDQQKEEKPKAKVNLESIKPQLDEIKALLKEDDGDAIDKIKMLREQLGNIPEYLQLENKANMYDFEEAINSLEKLTNVMIEEA